MSRPISIYLSIPGLEETNLNRTATLLLLTVCLAYCQDAGKSTQERVDKVFEKWNSTSSPGCALSVMKDGQIVYKRGYGMADLDHDIPITPETVFHVASISKQFTAAAILLLAQEGKLSLDDDVHKYIKELPDFGVKITIGHLLHHTSGLRDQWELLDLAGWRYSLDLITDDDVPQYDQHALPRRPCRNREADRLRLCRRKKRLSPQRHEF
jgi:CubicO group peptidase (beta-lactamase class C family)